MSRNISSRFLFSILEEEQENKEQKRGEKSMKLTCQVFRFPPWLRYENAG